ncbi:hypothetical protein RQP46_009591 [Phenoliferia psychrophenolica]
MRSSLIALALSASLVTAFDHNVMPGRGLHARKLRMEPLVRRQASNGTSAVSPAAISVPSAATTSSPVVAASTAASTPGNILNSIVNPVATSSAVTGASTASSILPGVSNILSSAAGSLPVSSIASKLTATKGAATTSTSTASVSGTSSGSSSSASSSSSAAADSSTKTSSGIGHATLIVIIVIASCVAGIAAIWTIIRKTKFSPSRRFEAKLAPIAFGGDRTGRDSLEGDNFGPGIAHNRSQSAMSNHSGANAGSFQTGSGAYPSSNLARSDSGGNGSLRGAPMTEVSHLPGSIPYSQSSYTGQPYYAGQSPYGAGAAGYPAENSHGGQYADLQRGPSSARPYNGGNPGYNNYQGQTAPPPPRPQW